MIWQSSDNSLSLSFAFNHALYGTPNMLLDDKYHIVAKKNQNHTELNDVKKRYSIGTKFIHRWHSVDKVYVLKKTSYPFIYLMKLVTSGKA